MQTGGSPIGALKFLSRNIFSSIQVSLQNISTTFFILKALPFVLSIQCQYLQCDEVYQHKATMHSRQQQDILPYARLAVLKIL